MALTHEEAVWHYVQVKLNFRRMQRHIDAGLSLLWFKDVLGRWLDELHHLQQVLGIQKVSALKLQIMTYYLTLNKQLCN